MTTTPVPVDPELEAALPTILESMPSRRDRSIPIEQVIAGRPVEVEDRAIPGPEAEPDVMVSIVRPKGGTSDAPGMYYVHGGGMISGNRFMRIPELVDWADGYGVVGVSVEYRLAPENPYPAAAEDCYAGLVWMADNAEELGIDPTRLLVMGGSAGGGLAAAAALMARDRAGPALVGQLLDCPMLDDRNETTSSYQFDGETVHNRSANLRGWTAYLGDARGGPDVSPYAAPARATDLSGLPPAYIGVGSAEVFRDEDVDYATRIWAAGGQAELHVWAGGFHGFMALAPGSALAKADRQARKSWILRTLDL